MILTTPKIVIERLQWPLEKCRTLETTKRIVEHRTDTEQKSQVDQLANKSNARTLIVEKRAQYDQRIQFSQFDSLRQIHDRKVTQAAMHCVRTMVISTYVNWTATTSFFSRLNEVMA